MKNIKQRVHAVVTSLLMMTSFATSAFQIDTSTTAVSGLWWNSNESGWGATFTQQFGVLFVTIFTYDSGGNPTWYVASNCAVSGGGCSGQLFRVTGGSSLTANWNGSSLNVAPVGSITINFSDVNTGSMTYTINGATSSKAITRQVFASAPVAADPRAKTLEMVGTWQIYSGDRQTLWAQYSLSGTSVTQGVNGYFIKGSNQHPYPGFASFLDGTAVQAGYNTTTSKYYIIDFSAENGFIWEFQFDSVPKDATGCRYRYPSTSSDKGQCIAAFASHF